ncbi:MAG: DUF4861 family protein [Phycisphaeraceae bacterium]|nr:MAG: DUF4861 family protein [Phycisphaeraceae bacterium]
MARWRTLARFLSLAVVSLVVPPGRAAEALPDPASVLDRMRLAADWELAHEDEYVQHGLTGWVAGAWYTGLAATADTTGDEKYYDAMRDIGERTGWQLGSRPWHADDHTVGQMYCYMYERDRVPKMIEAVRARYSEMLERPLPESLEYTDERTNEAWVWCDALFMSPPTMAMLATATGEPRYLDKMSDLWWQVADELYDPQERLFFRDSRFFDRRSENGEKVFWSRGNGWVFAGTVRVLENMPADSPHRAQFVRLYKTMASRIIEIQTTDGTWHPSLLDPGHPEVRESSGTGFFVYGLAWGVNQGLLDRETYLPHILKGWDALCDAQHGDGKIGWVQRIGDAPEHTNADSTGPYAVGSFLLAASEVYRAAVLGGAASAEVATTNPLDRARFSETIELDWQTVSSKVPGVTPDNVVVVDGRSGRLLETQTVDLEGDGGTDLLLFQADYMPREHRSFEIYAVKGDRPPPESPRVFGRYVPERKDDFAWENDRTAHRMYGPALAVENAQDGIDLWVKSVRTPVIDTWYARGEYHEDHGEGMDAYSVGATLGDGGFGLFADGKVIVPPVYATQRRIANGPIRVMFELGYPEFDTPDGKMSLTLRVSLDKGRSLNRIQALLHAPEGVSTVRVVGGMARHGGDGEVRQGRRWVSLCEATEGHPETTTCCGVAMPNSMTRMVDADRHVMLLTEIQPWQPLVYYAGGGWTGGIDFASAADWEEYMDGEAKRLAAPIRVAW